MNTWTTPSRSYCRQYTVCKCEKLLLNVIPVASAKVKHEYYEFLKAVNIKGFIYCCLFLDLGKNLTPEMISDVVFLNWSCGSA